MYYTLRRGPQLFAAPVLVSVFPVTGLSVSPMFTQLTDTVAVGGGGGGGRLIGGGDGGGLAT